MDTKNIQNIIIGIILCAWMSSCVKDKPQTPVVVTPATADEAVYVVCEGNFGTGEGSLYQYDSKTGSASGDIYAAANNGNKLGDVFQSMARLGDKLFLCINSSDKVVVLNRADKKQIGVLNIAKPRYILPVNDTKAYVSTLYSKKIYIINPQSMQVTGSIETPYLNPEGMVLFNGKAYVCNWDTACRSIFAINTANDVIEKTIPISGAAPQAALVDKHNRLWIISGNQPKKKAAAITVLNAQGQIERSYSFPEKADVIKPAFNASKDTLYFIEVNYAGGNEHNGVFRIGIDDKALPAQAFIQAGSFQYFWALGISPANNKIYVGDPKGFIQKGSVAVYNADGSYTATFDVGIGPGHFLFD